MKAKEFLGAFLLFLFITAFFFYPLIFRGWLPFPGDLLVGHYEPYKSNSYFGWGPGAVPHKAQGPDVIRESYPWKFLAIETMKSGELPWWNPYNFAGNPQLANFQTAVFYPVNFLFFLPAGRQGLLPFNLAWTIFIFFQPLLAAFFTYLFCRQLNFSKLAAVFSAIIFAFSSYLIVWLEYGNMGHAILWLPLVLYLVERLAKNFTWGKITALIITLTFSILAGFIQTTIYLLGTVFFYFLYRFRQIKERKISHFLFFLGALVTPLFLAAFQLLPSGELFRFSARDPYPQEELVRLLSPLYYVITTFVPDFFGHPATRNHWFWGTYIERVSYVGVIPLLLAIFLFLSPKKRPFWFFFFLAAVSYVLSLDIWPTRFLFSLQPPIISTAVPTRILSLFCFSAAILAGMGLNSWLTEKNFKKIFKAAAVLLGVYFLVWIFIFLAPKLFSQSSWVLNLSVSRRNLILPTFLALAGSALLILGPIFPAKKKVAAMIIFITIFDLFYFFQKITPFSPPEFVFPQTEVMEFLRNKAGIDRFWGYGAASIETNFATQEQVFSPEGSDALHLRRYGELLSASKEGKISPRIPRRDANIFPGYGPTDLKNNFFRQRILNLLGVKYILHKNDLLTQEWEPDYQTFPENIYKLVWQKEKWQVYENIQALPRFFLTSQYLVEDNERKIIEKIFDQSFDLKTVILEENLPLPLKDVASEAKLVRYRPNEIEMVINTQGNQLLFLSDNYYPGWQAQVDGQKTKIYRAHYSFRAIVVPKGKHQVKFFYQPQFFLWKS